MSILSGRSMMKHINTWNAESRKDSPRLPASSDRACYLWSHSGLSFRDSQLRSRRDHLATVTITATDTPLTASNRHGVYVKFLAWLLYLQMVVGTAHRVFEKRREKH